MGEQREDILIKVFQQHPMLQNAPKLATRMYPNERGNFDECNFTPY